MVGWFGIYLSTRGEGRCAVPSPSILLTTLSIVLTHPFFAYAIGVRSHYLPNSGN
ncbi:hypothetical protein OAF95_03080 [Akkermansiaceae bacterium]|nr:hypothetical protein [Akkermansiaceae bacterium]